MLTEEEIIFDEEDGAISFASEEDLEKNLKKMLDPLFSDILRFWGTGLHSNLLEKVEKFLIQKALAETGGIRSRQPNYWESVGIHYATE